VRGLGLAVAELTHHYPRPGWIEHDPELRVDGGAAKNSFLASYRPITSGFRSSGR
jgi:glycerol kinase